MGSGDVPVGGRRQWLAALLLIAALGTVEIAAVALIGHRLLPVAVAWLLDAIGVIALLGTAFVVASATWRTHAVRAQEVRLVLGYLGEVRAPRSAVVSVECLPPLRPIESDRTGPVFDGDRLVLTAAGGIPRVEIRLVPPQLGRRLWQRRLIDAVVVTDPESALPRLLTQTHPHGGQ